MSKIRLVKNPRFLKEIAFWGTLFLFLTIIFRLIIIYRINSGEFSLREAKIYFDNGEALTDAEGFKYLGIKKGISIFRIDPARLSKKLLQEHPEALRVEVYKKPPSSLEVRVANRVPVAQIHLGQFYPLDSKGFILPFPSNFRIEKLPNIQGIRAEEVNIGGENKDPRIALALKILLLLRDKFGEEYCNRIDVDISDVRNIELILPQKIRVKLGGNNFKEKIARLFLVLKDVKAKNLSPTFIDLRFPKVILKPRD